MHYQKFQSSIDERVNADRKQHRTRSIKSMPPQLRENVLVTLLRQCYITPKCQSHPRRLAARTKLQTRCFRISTGIQFQQDDYENRSLSSPVTLFESHVHNGDVVLANKVETPSRSGTPQPSTPPQDIAILGGGITGLASAYYLARELPNANITLYEASDRLGGWLRTKHVDVGNGNIVFEQGPRTLRPAPPAGLVTLNLIKLLGLEDELIITPKDSDAAKNRFVYYPDHLVRMPGPGGDFFDTIWSLMTEPIFKGCFSGIWKEQNVPKRPDSLEDESVGSFFRRRFGGAAIPDNIVSAVLHGIYAGDLYQLSIKSLQPQLWHSEGRYGSLIDGFFANRSKGLSTVQYRDGALTQEMTDNPDQLARSSDMSFASVYSFKKGISQLSDTMVTKLEENPSVSIKSGTQIEKVVYDGASKRVKISTSMNQPAKSFDRVLSTISGRTLSKLVDEKTPLPSLAATHAVTVMVVNLYYRNPLLLPVHGFGYLIPRSIPYEQNPEMALGVIFDSDAAAGQDSVPGTKLTVMMGGHWWDGLTSYPDEEQGAAMAKAVLLRHLKIDAEPEFVNVGLQRECIPQYTVGHEARMKKAHGELMSGFKGRLSVAGNSYTGVGMNDCVRSARDLALDVAGYEGSDGVTGLEQFVTERMWVKATMSPP